jgi:hypothetical protein
MRLIDPDHRKPGLKSKIQRRLLQLAPVTERSEFTGTAEDGDSGGPSSRIPWWGVPHDRHL